MALAYVQQKAATVTDGATIAFDSNVSSDSLLVACVLITGAANVVNSITDTRGNTWTEAVRKAGTIAGAGTNFNSMIWYAHNANAGANTLTLDYSAASNGQICIVEFSGFSGVTLDQTNSNEGDNVNPAPCGSITTTQAEEVIIATISHAAAFTVSSRLAGWNGLTVGSRRDSQYKITSGTETTNGEVTYSTVADITAVIASFYAPAGGGGGGTTTDGKVIIRSTAA